MKSEFAKASRSTFQFCNSCEIPDLVRDQRSAMAPPSRSIPLMGFGYFFFLIPNQLADSFIPLGCSVSFIWRDFVLTTPTARGGFVFFLFGCWCFCGGGLFATPTRKPPSAAPPPAVSSPLPQASLSLLDSPAQCTISSLHPQTEVL